MAVRHHQVLDGQLVHVDRVVALVVLAGERLGILLARVVLDHLGVDVLHAARSAVDVHAQILLLHELGLPDRLDELEGVLPVERSLRYVEAVVARADHRLVVLESDELHARLGHAVGVVREGHLLLRVAHVDMVHREVRPEAAAVDVLVEDVGADPLVVQADVRRLGAGMAPCVVEREHDVVRVLARLARPQLEVVVVPVGHAPLPSPLLVRPRLVVDRHADDLVHIGHDPTSL